MGVSMWAFRFAHTYKDTPKKQKNFIFTQPFLYKANRLYIILQV
ncbi:MAG: hypothetical protein NZ455_13830 [Bacteroidia bacterium]|nr:hypothetical protein [Bacteroidia bacterium]